MMQPMPAQGAPEQPQAQGGSSGPGALISDLQAGLKKLGSLFEKSGLPTDKLGQAISIFEEAMDEAMGGGDDAPAKAAPAGVSTPEQGGNPNARPM